MNDRIKELELQAHELAWQEWKQLPESNNGVKIDANGLGRFKNKFAELIVRECANVLRVESERLYKLSAEEKDELFASNFEICAEKCVDNELAIKEHFGVE